MGMCMDECIEQCLWWVFVGFVLVGDDDDVGVIDCVEIVGQLYLCIIEYVQCVGFVCVQLGVVLGYVEFWLYWCEQVNCVVEFEQFLVVVGNDGDEWCVGIGGWVGYGLMLWVVVCGVECCVGMR